jgi:hypothetical protein
MSDIDKSVIVGALSTTEQGVAMLSAVLRSEPAEKVSMRIPSPQLVEQFIEEQMREMRG